MGQVSLCQCHSQLSKAKIWKCFLILIYSFYFSLQDQCLWIWKFQEWFFWLGKQWMKLWIICFNKKWINLKVCSIYLFPQKNQLYSHIIFVTSQWHSFLGGWKDNRIYPFLTYVVWCNRNEITEIPRWESFYLYIIISWV